MVDNEQDETEKLRAQLASAECEATERRAEAAGLRHALAVAQQELHNARAALQAALEAESFTRRVESSRAHELRFVAITDCAHPSSYLTGRTGLTAEGVVYFQLAQGGWVRVDMREVDDRGNPVGGGGK